MTAEDRPVRAFQALLGLGVLAAVLVVVVAGLQGLVRPGDIEPPLAGPAAPSGADPCGLVAVGATRGEPVRASDLIECPQRFDGRVVSYRGEVIRAVLRRGRRAWVQVNDDPYADIGPLPEHRTAVGGNSGIPVSIPLTAAGQLGYVGSYRAQGDVITVTGTFHRADPADGGGPTIQATQVTIEKRGRPVPREASGTRVTTAAVLALLALGLAGGNRISAHRA